MRRTALVAFVGVVFALGLGAPVAAAAVALPLPPPPTLPPTTPPAALEPYLVLAGPTVGAVCGTASLGILLTPSLAQGFLHIPLSELIDPHTLDQYGSTALYLCGFIPSPLDASRCAIDNQILDALRGLNPLIAQVVGLYPEGATVDTLLDLEMLLPSGPSVVGPAIASLSEGLDCARAAGVPKTPAAAKTAPTVPAAVPPAPAIPVAAAPVTADLPPSFKPSPSSPALAAPSVGVGAVATPATLPVIFESKLTARTGVEWLGVILGALIAVSSLGGWLWARRKEVV